MDTQPIRVLFLCTGNSCRSQIAEGLARSLGGQHLEVFSAGTAPRPVHPLAIQVMSEVGIDISGHQSKPLEGFLHQRFDFVITVCDRAKESCSTLPTAREDIHWRIDDPAEVTGSVETQLATFRRVRDDLRRRISLFLLANHIHENTRVR